MKIKKVLALILALCMMTALVACGGGGSKNDGGNAGGDTQQSSGGGGEEELYIGILMKNFSSTNSNRTRIAMTDKLTEMGIKCEAFDANGDQAQQNEQLDALIADGASCVIIQAVNTASAATMLETCKAANMPVVFFNNEPADLSPIAACENAIFIGTDTAEGGILQAELFMQHWDADPSLDRNGDGVAQYVVFQGSADSEEAIDRSTYCYTAAEDKGYKFESLADPYICNWDTTTAFEQCTGFLAANIDDIEVIFCNNDAIADGVISALSDYGFNTGKDGDSNILVYGVDGTEVGLALIDAGKLSGTVIQQCELMGSVNVDIALSFIEGKNYTDAAAAAGWELDDTGSIRINYLPHSN